MARDGRRYRSPTSSSMNRRREGVLVFTRIPQVARVKTRLIPALGAEGAAEVHARMMQHAIRQAKVVAAWRDAMFEIRFTNGHESSMRRWLTEDVPLKPQIEGDLGDRLRCAIEEAFRDGLQRVIAIGTDCPELDAARMSVALDALHRRDVVLGPALDGGYYLIGVRRHVPELFHGIDWGTDKVAEQTRERIDAAGLTLTELQPLGDVDEPDDLHRWHRVQSGRTNSGCSSFKRAPKLSVIIPTLNEASHLPMTLASACHESDVEVLVVDGESTDETVEVAHKWAGVQIIRSKRGRAKQMNTGAKAARGEVLLFLHGDTRLPVDYPRAVESILNQPKVVAGAFRLSFDPDSPALRLIAFGANVRSRMRRLPYGDQAIFIRKDSFERLGGFRPLPVMEDYEMIRRLRQIGRIAVAESSRPRLAN